MRSFTLTSIFSLLLCSVSATAPAETFDGRDFHQQSIHKRDGELNLLGYSCGWDFYSIPRIDATVSKACKEVNKSRWIKPKFPKIYEPKNSDPKFSKISGNQFIYPILKKGFYSRLRRAHRHRIVLNNECQLAGLVTEKKSLGATLTAGLAGSTTYTKCKKLYNMID